MLRGRSRSRLVACSGIRCGVDSRRYGGVAWFLGEWLYVLTIPYAIWLWVVRRPLVLSERHKRIAMIVTHFIATVVVSDEVISREAPQVFMRLMPSFGGTF